MNKNLNKEWYFSHLVSRARLGVRLRVRLGVATTTNLTQRPYTSAFEGCWDISIAFLPMHEIMRISMRMDEEDIQVVGIVCPVIKIIESPLLVRVMGILSKRIAIKSKAAP